MKNKIRKSLDRELRDVRVSSELKKRILAEAGASRAPERNRRTSVMPLAAAAAVVLMIGLTAGITMLRAEKPDLSATPLSAATAEPVKNVVYVSDDDGLYHWRIDCGAMTDARSVKPEEARAEGRKACSECLTGEVNGVQELVWMTPSGKYYHERHDCSGMSGAIGLLQIEARTLGRWACPVCMGGEIMPEETLAPNPLPTEAPMPGPIAEQEELPTAIPTPDPLATAEPEQYVLPTAAATEEPTAAPLNENISASSMEDVMDAEGEISLWMTDGGVYYHYDEHCSGMEGAHVCTEEEAAKAGKILCMVCAPEEADSSVNEIGGADGPTAVWVTSEERSVWMNDGGAYYHTDEHCSGMEGAYISDESAAAENGKYPCPVCLADRYEEEVQFVWMTDNGLYYHTDEYCSGMEGAYGCEVLEALAKGKLPCPKCSKQLSGVWATENGMYYHLTSDCSGMTGAQEISGNDAVMQGKTLCPVCRNEIAEAAVAAEVQHNKKERPVN